MTSCKEDRALAIGIVGFIAMVAIAAILYTLFDPAVSQLTTTTLDATNNQDATDVINERNTIWGLFLFYALFLSAVWVIARAVRESNRSGF